MGLRLRLEGGWGRGCTASTGGWCGEVNMKANLRQVRLELRLSLAKVGQNVFCWLTFKQHYFCIFNIDINSIFSSDTLEGEAQLFSPFIHRFLNFKPDPEQHIVHLARLEHLISHCQHHPLSPYLVSPHIIMCNRPWISQPCFLHIDSLETYMV